MKLLIRENVRVALSSIRSQLLRTILTILIIALGIMALVGILTAIDAIKFSISSNFQRMGANSFTIRNKGMNVHVGKGGKRPKNYKTISFREAMAFKEDFRFPAVVSVMTYASQTSTVKYGDKKTNPNIGIVGTDENYLLTSGFDVDKGRNFVPGEITSGAHVVIVGSEIVDLLFTPGEDPLEKVISIGNGKYRIIGILKEKGSGMGFSGDRRCILPINNTRQYFSRPNESFTITVQALRSSDLEKSIDEARGFFRSIRKIPVSEEDNFEIAKSDSLAEMLISNISYVTMAATLIGFITLLGAAVGLMNIMLVSVTERTREIGIRKATGATSQLIRNQFLIEAIVVCQLGGILGIVLGILIGNLISVAVGGPFIIPWIWIIAGVIICFFVGLASGIYPAMRAAKLDPIDALRYE
ncbi:MAG: ABC transporter permease [Bacteroidetes bacterium]|nr:ABC transporter permease [Bacteroidota bacterium]MBU1721128.1 ABC transporter permease [Bacteroidota bacterium]